MDGKKFKKLKEKVKGAFSNVKERVSEEEKTGKIVQPLVTSRVLFISILHKLFFIGFVLSFASFILTAWLVLTKYSVSGSVGGYFGSIISIIFKYALVLFSGWIYYLILNWLYKCASKTMLCLTEKEIYGEFYAPFYRGEFSVPIENVTKVDTIKILWIFRYLIIHRYHQIPIIFPTWNAQEFKDRLVCLLTDRNEKIANEFKNMDILPNWVKQKKKIIFIIFAVILGLILVSFTVKYFNNPYSKVPGTYSLNGDNIELDSDGTCNISSIVDKDIVSCTWSTTGYSDVNVERIPVYVSYEYDYSSRWYSGTYDANITLYFNANDKTITYNSTVYSK